MDNRQSQQKLVHRSSSMCPGEQQHIRHRKQEAVQALAALGITCTAEEVPHTALLGSGGGQRAAVSLMGSLAQLSQDSLLDSVLYLAGVSGSTWTMVTLYGDPQWSGSVDKHEAAMLNAKLDCDPVQSWLHKVIRRDDFSLSDVWAILTAVGCMKENLEKYTWKLSENANRDATNPYPIYCTTEKSCLNKDHVKGKWFELSPHEAGFPELEMFVDTPFLSSSFSGGSLEKKEPEMDMMQLQGILGSAVANLKTVDFSPSWLNAAEYKEAAAEYLHTYNTFIAFINYTKAYHHNNIALKDLDKLQETLSARVMNNDRNAEVLMSLNTEDLKQQFQSWIDDLYNDVLDWIKTLIRSVEDAYLFFKKLIPLILKWEWGTVKNFLYEYKEVPEFIWSQENIHLIDAGLMNNVGYASFLGPKRDMDLLFILEFSIGEMFETLMDARDYAAEVQKPFPKLDDKVLNEEKDWPRGSYVFDGEGSAPTIVYMPLFNRNNCKDAAECKQKMEEFDTFQTGFSRDMMERLLDIAKGNIRSCKDVLVEELQKAVQRRRDKISQGNQ